MSVLKGRDVSEVESGTGVALLGCETFGGDARVATESVRCIEKEDCFRGL